MSISTAKTASTERQTRAQTVKQKKNEARTVRADRTELKRIFRKYASIERDGEVFMSPEDFFQRYLGIHSENDYSRQSLRLLVGVVDQTKNGLISFDEFSSFESLLASPDSLYQCMFQLFDANSNGVVSFGEFCHVVQSTEVYQHFPFNFNSPLTQLYFGIKHKDTLHFSEFTQLIRDLQDEMIQQVFSQNETDKQTTITALAFANVMKKFRPQLLSPYVQENLVTVSGCSGVYSRTVGYGYFRAFNRMLNNLDLFKQVVRNAMGRTKTEITKEELMVAASNFPQITPLEVDIVFQLSDLDKKSGRITMDDFKRLLPSVSQLGLKEVSGLGVEDGKREIGYVMATLESVYRFGLGAIAGAVGATAVYPIDLVKTRLQNQRKRRVVVGELFYRNSFDCFWKVLRHEGVFGLYRGLGPQLIGVAPEKAIKLTTNDFMREKLTSKNGHLPFYREIIAGGCAGASQVIFSNPLEIVKIRLQVAGQFTGIKPPSALKIVADLGFKGLYKGISACLLRDIPFSAIYFSSYAHLKPKLADDDGYNSPLSLLVAAATCGIPAAFLGTPADVIKTRLQVQVREGQTKYTGLVDCARKIWHEEGFKKFWSGAPARVFRSSPQFGVTLMVYELLQQLFDVDFGRGKFSEQGKRKRERAQMLQMAPFLTPTNPDHIGGYRMAVATFASLESKFGLKFPNYTVPQVSADKKPGASHE
ncbi:electrogenic aspartate/glutamate antiporter SLC25A13, mitochondrial-like [Corticium candelabrum]|uniref:electrogenic aspartate/glutamate antiporter SLC25A13, mitochondrial-like n=1 Tax=Corticium candelabrum TaxID=121492 RepID=UPI002E26356D|nr:electrogenic aspartate/glutamate antiporter SLC25A13, mitochondrial-like [Corticium candelabrum]